MGTLHAIVGSKAKPEVDLELVKLLEILLEEARACEILAVIAIVEHTDEDKEPDFIEVGDYDPWRMRGLLDEFKSVITCDDDDDDLQRS